jgi:hypothetical protein
MKLPKGRVLGKFPGRPGVVFDALGQVPAGLNGYIRVVGPEPTGQIGVILLEHGEPVGCLVAGGKQSFGRQAVAPLWDLAADESSQVRLIGFYEESLEEVRATADNMKRVAAVTRADINAMRRGAPAPKGAKPPRPDPKTEAQVVDAVKASAPPKTDAQGRPNDAGFFKELLETGIRAARVESEATGEALDPDMAAKLEDYLSRSNLQLDDAITTIASVITPKPGQRPPSPEEKALPPALKEEIKGAEEQLAKTAQRYEYLLTKDMASAKALRDQEENLTKMEGQLKDLKTTVQIEGERRLRELEQQSSRASGAEAQNILRKLKEEQEAIYARVEKLVQMENLFKQNLLTQRKRIDQKEQELQALASQLKSDFLERKRLLDEEKESYLEDLRRQSKDLKTREAVAVERERRASELAAKLESEIEVKIKEVERKRLDYEAKDRELRSRAEALKLRESEAAARGKAGGESRAEVARLRGELSKEREESAARIAALAKREEELRSLEARLNDRIKQVESQESEPAQEMDADELKELISYLDRLLEALPPDRVSEFAASEFYQLYIKLLERLGI